MQLGTDCTQRGLWMREPADDTFIPGGAWHSDGVGPWWCGRLVTSWAWSCRLMASLSKKARAKAARAW